MAFDFPTSPAVGTISNGYTWDGQKWVSVGTGAAIIAATPPLGAVNGDLWWDSDDGKLYIYYDDGTSAQWVAVGGAGSGGGVSASALAYSGMQINGSASVSQQLGASGANLSSAVAYFCDGWAAYKSASATVAGIANAAVSGFFPGYQSLINVAISTGQASIGAAESVQIFQRIEGYRVGRLAWGTSSAQPITISFWSAHNRVGIYSVYVQNIDATRSCVASYTQNVADVPEFKTITIPGDTAGVWATDNTAGMTLSFILACGTTLIAPATNTWYGATYLAAPGQINGVAAATDRFRLTGIAVIPGTSAPTAAQSPNIMRPFDQELRVCERYWQRATLSAIGTYFSGAAQTHYVTSPLRTEMRATPTLTVFGTPPVVAANVTYAFGPSSPRDLRVDVVANALGTGWITDLNVACNARL